jgi:hypothetical protein
MSIKVNRKAKTIQLDIKEVKEMDELKDNEDFKGIVKDNLVSAGISAIQDYTKKDNPNFAVVVDPLLEQELVQREKYLKDKEHLKQINKDLKKFIVGRGVAKVQIGDFVIELSSENVDVAKVPKEVREQYLETKTKTTMDITKVAKNE